jgi:hypothetical protein
MLSNKALQVWKILQFLPLAFIWINPKLARHIGDGIVAREFCLNCFLVIEQLLHAWPLLDPFEMRHAIREFQSLGAELGAASQAPEEMGIRRCKVIEEEFTPSEHVVGDLVVLEQKGLRRLDDALLGTASVRDFRRRVEARQIGMYIGRAPRQDRDRLELLPRVGWQQLRLREIARDPYLDGGALRQS